MLKSAMGNNVKGVFTLALLVRTRVWLTSEFGLFGWCVNAVFGTSPGKSGLRYGSCESCEGKVLISHDIDLVSRSESLLNTLG